MKKLELLAMRQLYATRKMLKTAREDVPIKGKPIHNKAGRCSRCRHEITYKAIGRLGRRLDTDEVCVYLIQSRPDGFVVREFWAGKRYRKQNLRTPEMHCCERWRTVYDNSFQRRSYYWDLYKQLTMRWIAGIPSYSWGSIYNTRGNEPGRVYGKTLPQLKSKLKQSGLPDWIYGHGMIANMTGRDRISGKLRSSSRSGRELSKNG